MRLYNSNETNFTHNGLGLLSDAISSVATEELNGMFELKIEYDSEGFLVDSIKEEMIIKAKANDKQDEQLFRIYSITKNHETDNLIIDAQHITYDLGNNFIEKLEATSLTKRQVMEQIGLSTNYPHSFNVTSSNNTTRSSTSLYRTNPLQMIGGMEGSVLQIWGGQIERDNFNLILHDRRGSDDGVKVLYKKNLTGLTAKFDIENLVTRIFPYVYIPAIDDEPEQLITVPGKYIDSPHIDNYEMPYVLPVDYSYEDGIETSQDLLNVASNWFAETGRDKPRVEMEVQFEHLWETEEYKDVAALELVGMGDTITVEHSKLKVEGTAIVNRIEYDVLARKNIAVDAGHVKARFTDKVNEVGNVVEKVDQADQKANQAISTANGKNTIYYGPDEPTNGNKDDLWFRVVDGEYTRTYRFDGIQWQLVVSKEVADIEETANTAHNRADEAVEKANLATSNATEAINEAQSAFDKAQESLTTAEGASDLASTAQSVANNAVDLATTASTDAQTAMTDAQSALGGVDDLQTYVSVEIDDINGELSRKVSQTDFNSLAGTVESHTTSISQNATAITRKADSEYVDTINKTVESNSLLITETAEGLDLKADKSVVNTLTGQVEAHSLELQAHANELSHKMTTVDADAKYATQSALQQTSQSLSSDIVAVQGNLDGLEIGGRNLLRNSEGPFELKPRNEGVSGDNYQYQRFYCDMEVGKEYTISAKIEVTHGDYDEVTIYVYPSGTRRNVPIEGDGTVKSTFIKTNENSDSVLIYAGIAGATRNQGAIISNVQIEKGNKATDWTPAPEDIQSQFSSINQTVSDITTRLGDSEGNISALQQTVGSFATRIEDNEGNISTLTQTAQGLQNRVSDAEGNISNVTQLANTLQTDLRDAEGNINTLTATASSLQSTIEGMGSGTNLIPNGSFENDGFGWNLNSRASIYTSDKKHGSKSLRIVSGSGIVNQTLKVGSINVIPGHTYHVEYWYKTSSDFNGQSGNNKLRFGFSSDETTTVHRSFGWSGSKTEWTKMEGSWTVPNDVSVVTPTIVSNHTNGWVLWDGIIFKDINDIKDMATQSQITQLSNNINARVEKDDVINQINIDTSGVLISGKKLILDGNTTVTGTFRVNNANITSVDAGKITTGELDAGRVSVINLSANSIIGGILQSQNSNTTFNLNDGILHIEDNDITFGSSANINFESTSNRLIYKYAYGGRTRSAGLGMGTALGGEAPYAFLGASAYDYLDSLDDTFTGFIVNTTRRINAGGANSITGNRLELRNKAVGYDKGITYDFFGSNPSIIPRGASTYNYILGEESNRFYRAYIDYLRTVGDFTLRNAFDNAHGWRIETSRQSSDRSISFYPLAPARDTYNIGRTSHRINNLYLRNEPNVSSDERLKESIQDNPLGLDFIKGIRTKMYRMISTNRKIQGVQYGIIAQQLKNVLADHCTNIDDISMLSKGEDGYYGVQITQLIAPTIKGLQELDMKVDLTREELILKIAELESRINKMESVA